MNYAEMNDDHTDEDDIMPVKRADQSAAYGQPKPDPFRVLDDLRQKQQAGNQPSEKQAVRTGPANHKSNPQYL